MTQFPDNSGTEQPFGKWRTARRRLMSGCHRRLTPEPEELGSGGGGSGWFRAVAWGTVAALCVTVAAPDNQSEGIWRWSH